jgi:hypothetical protein
LGAALLGGCGEAEPPRWVSIQGDGLEFLPPQGISVEHAFGSPRFHRRGRRGGSIGIAEISTNWSPYAETLFHEVRRNVAKAPRCSAPDATQGRLSNGWESAWTEMRCPEGPPRPIVIFAAEGKRYVVSGDGFAIAEMLALAGSGRVLSPERRASLALGKRTGPMEDVDRISGGPAARRTLALAACAWIALAFAGAFLWRAGGAMRAAAGVLCLIYAVCFGPFWAGLLFMAFSGVALFGVPGPASVAAVLGLMLLSAAAAAVLSRRRRTPP